MKLKIFLGNSNKIFRNRDRSKKRRSVFCRSVSSEFLEIRIVSLQVFMRMIRNFDTASIEFEIPIWRKNCSVWFLWNDYEEIFLVSLFIMIRGDKKETITIETGSSTDAVNPSMQWGSTSVCHSIEHTFSSIFKTRTSVLMPEDVRPVWLILYLH